MTGGFRKHVCLFERAPRRQEPRSERDLADKPPPLRSVLEAALEPFNASLSHFSRVSNCLRELAERPCDLLIIDLEGGEEEGLEMIGEARRLVPWLSCLALVGHADVRSAVQAVQAGACECLEKPLHEDRLLRSVEAHLVRLDKPGSRSRRGLTETEIRILQLILAGNTSRDIADGLHRSKRTVDVHRKNIMRKLGATSPVDLIKRALDLGLTPRQSDREPPVPKR